MRKAIGVFDSGVGGLTVTRELIAQLPHEDIVYFGDTARALRHKIKRNSHPFFYREYPFYAEGRCKIDLHRL